MQRANLADSRATCERRLGARDRDVDIRGRCFHARRPRVDVYGARGRRKPLAGRTKPALACEVAKGARAVARDGNPDIVERRIARAAVIDAAWIVPRMIARVEPAPRQVVSADERDGIIDDDDLLMMRCADRLLVVEGKFQPR